MATFYLCNRTIGKCSRLEVQDVNAKGNVSDFRKLVSKAIDVPQHEIELLYGGYSLEDGKTLDSYGARPGVTVHALRKHDSDMHQDPPEKMDEAVVQQVVTALQAALINPAFRSTVERMLTDPDTLENIVAATPGLDKDPVAISMLQDPELLALLADPSTSPKVINAHPALGQAAMMVAAAVNEEGVKAGSAVSGPNVSRSARGTYSLDQMSDDEDMDGAPSHLGAGFPASITPSLLAAAIAAAGGGNSSGGSPSQTTSATPANQAGLSASSVITSDFFRQAIAAAADTTSSNQSSNGATPTQEIPPHILQAQLDQLRDMGITDESAARNALQATNGNLEAAIALLFGDGGF